jgi:hypothetical protein
MTAFVVTVETCTQCMSANSLTLAPVALHRSASLSGLRAASATLTPRAESFFASDALRPGPAPTISADILLIDASSSLAYVVCHVEPPDFSNVLILSTLFGSVRGDDDCSLMSCPDAGRGCRGVAIGRSPLAAERVAWDDRFVDRVCVFRLLRAWQ